MIQFLINCKQSINLGFNEVSSSGTLKNRDTPSLCSVLTDCSYDEVLLLLNFYQLPRENFFFLFFLFIRSEWSLFCEPHWHIDQHLPYDFFIYTRSLSLFMLQRTSLYSALNHIMLSEISAITIVLFDFLMNCVSSIFIMGTELHFMGVKVSYKISRRLRRHRHCHHHQHHAVVDTHSQLSLNIFDQKIICWKAIER